MLGRIHPAQKAIDSIAMARRNGFVNISIDLIFGIWNETLSDWKEELKRAVSLPIRHISCYSLSYERHTKLFTLLGSKKIIPQSDEVIVKMYEHTVRYLEQNKFRHYEVSNFSKSGFECRHNLSYWQNNPYLGLGPSAVSYQNGIRAKNTPDVEEYIEMAQRNKPTIISTEKLSLQKQAKETAAIKIRTREGIDFSWFKKRTGFDFMELEGEDAAVLTKEGLIKYKKNKQKTAGVALTKKGFLFCDSVSSQFL
jgi:oxygen-independent coproporphyrinogen-3 oxidase